MKSMTENRIDPKLSAERPDVAIVISRKHDPCFLWDGDGDDPENEGFYPFDVTVKTVTVKDGRLIEGRSVLGGSYYRDGEAFEDLHGYYPQMLEEALAEMDAEVKQ